MADFVPCDRLLQKAYYVDPTTSSNAMNGSKLRVRILLSRKHCSLQAFVKHVVEHAGLRKETQKRGLGSRIDIKLYMPLRKRTR